MPLPSVVQALADAGDEMAVVIDEYGGFAGVLTIEDLAEELVGEIDDEHDSPTQLQVTADGVGWLVPGDLPLDEAERALGLALPPGDYETMAGMVIAHAAALPEVGDTVEIELPSDPADLVTDDAPAHRMLITQIRSLERRVPASMFVTVEEQSGDE